MQGKIATYTLRIMSVETPDNEYWKKKNQEVINNLGTALSEAEEVVNEWLPQGYYCKFDG